MTEVGPTRSGSSPSLTTERLRLVPCAEEHVDRLQAILIEPGVRRYLLDDAIVSRDWVVDLVASSRRTFEEERCGLWCLMASREGDALVGLAGLRRFPGAREPQLVYALDPAFWGRGLATEASRAVIDYTFEELGFAELLASTDPPNAASVAVMERLGMRFLEAGSASGHRLVFYRIGRADWARRRPQPAGPGERAAGALTL